MKKTLFLLIAVCVLVAFGLLSATRSAPAFYPVIELEARTLQQPKSPPEPAQPLTLRFVFDALPTLQQCEALTGKVARLSLAKCRFCVMRKLECASSLDAQQNEAFSDKPLAIPSGRMFNGVVLFDAPSPALALSACQESSRQSASSDNPIRCDEAGSERPVPGRPPIALGQAALYLPVFLAALAGAWLIGWLIVRYEHLHAHYSHDTHSGPQKFHANPTPRIGGIAIFSGLAAAGAILLLLDELPHEHEFGLLLLAALPAFLGGLVEDVTKRVGVMERLLLTMLSGAVASWLLGVTLDHLDVPWVDDALLIPAVAVIFTIFAVGGVANAINIIDGYNGLASGYAIIVLSAMAWVAWQVGDPFVLITAVALTGAMLGFMCWNWPGGKIFMGDGGAYLLGFLLAELAVLLVIRNPGISPWFPLALLIYPVFETCYSIYRRRIGLGTSPGQPDSKHLHQLIYKQIARPNECRLAHNSRVAKYLWLPILVVAVVGASFPRSVPLLLTLSMTWCIAYVVCYRLIVGRPSLHLTRTHGQEEASTAKTRKSRKPK